MMYTVLNNEGRPSRSNSQRETQGPVQLTSYFIPTDASMSFVSSKACFIPVTFTKDRGWRARYTDKKKKKFFIYKEIQKGPIAKSYLTKGLLIYG
jgi:hypothetical protein